MIISISSFESIYDSLWFIKELKFSKKFQHLLGARHHGTGELITLGKYIRVHGMETWGIHSDLLPIERNIIVMILGAQRNIIRQNIPVVIYHWVFSLLYWLTILFITFLFLGEFTKRFKQSSILVIDRLVWNFCGGVIYRWDFGFFLAKLLVPTRSPKINCKMLN